MAELPLVPGYDIIAIGMIGRVSSASDTVTGYASCGIVATALTATVKLQGSWDGGTTWIDLPILSMADNAGTLVTSVAFSGAVAVAYRGDVGAVPQHRWYCSAWTSATAAKGYPTKRQG